MTERALLVRVRAALVAGFTTSGHLAQRVEYERLGYCGWRGCSPSCLEAKALFLEVDSLIGDAGVEVEAPRQVGMFDEEVAG